MSDFNRSYKGEFVQEYAYVEDYSLFYESKYGKKESDEIFRGIVEIDLDNGKAIEVI